MPDNPKPEIVQRPPLQATLDTVGAAGQPADRTAQGPSAPPPLPPTTPVVPVELADLEGYDILKELGRGGMGVVYLARNRLMDRLEVLKVMSKSLVGQPAAVDRFLQEIRSAGRLIHPNVAMAHSAYQLGHLLVLAMEYVEGEDLAKVVRTRGALPIPQACYCVHQTATALQRGYELGLVHRDIKPGNVLLSKQGKRQVVKVIDFGLAKAKSEVTTEEGLTGTNQMMGTPGYTAPEQLRDAKNADTRSDIYSLGCLLYCLLTGKPPFMGASAYEVLIAQQTGEMRPLKEARPDVPDELAAIVARMMAPEPAARFRQPGEVAAALLPFVKGAKALPESSAEVPRAGTKPARPAAPPQAVPATLPTGLEAHHRDTMLAGEHQQVLSTPPTGPKTPPRPMRTDVALPAGQRTDRTTAAKPSAPARRARKIERRRPLLLPLLIVGGLLAVALIVLAGIVIKLSVKSEAGNALLVVTVDVPNADVYVDGEKVAVTWGSGGHKAAIAVTPGTHEVEVTKAGFTAVGDTVTLSDGGRKVLTASLSRSPPESADASDNAVPQTAIKPVPPRIVAATRKVYLSDLDETNWSGCAAFGKSGRSPVADIAVNGVGFPMGLWTHPPAGGYSTVQYRLSGLDAASFVTKVAINDSAGDAAGALLTFQVLGDGKVLWTAAPMRATRQTQECRISVKDVSVLELRVHCPNKPAEPVPGRPGNHGAHAVWLDPYLLLPGPPRATSEEPVMVAVPDRKNRAAAWKQGSIWTGTGHQEPGGTFDVKITVLKRDGDAFEGLYEVYGGQNTVNIKGTVSRTGAVAWRFTGAVKLINPIPSLPNARFEGLISGDTAAVDLTWPDPAQGFTARGKVELKLQGD
jgi:serine/threonine protein kinase